MKIESFNEWEPPELDCHECFARAVEEAAKTVDEALQGEYEFDDEFQGDWA